MASSSWQGVVAQRLRERDAREKIAYEPVALLYSNLWHTSLHNERALNKAATGELEKKLGEVREELVHVKRRADQASELKAQLTASKAQLGETQALLESESQTNSRHREDVSMLRDELGRVTRLLDLAEQKNRQLAKENFDLIDRVLTEKLTLADQLNEMTRLNAALTDKLDKLQGGGEASSNGTTASGASAATSTPAAAAASSSPGTATASLSDRDPVASSSRACTIRIQAHAQMEIPTIRYDEQGTVLYTCSCDGTIKAWDALDGKLLKTLRTTGTSSDTPQLMGMDCKQRVVCATGSDRAVRVWSLDTDRVCHTLLGHASKVYACRLTRDGKALVTGGTDRKIMTWDVVTGNRVRQISCSSICNAVDVYEHYVVSGHQDSCARLWDMRTGTMTACMSEVHSATISSVDFVSFRAVLTNSRDNSCALVDLAAPGRVDQRFSHATYRAAYNWSNAAMSPSHRMVGAGGADGKVYLWDASEISSAGSSEMTKCRTGTPLPHGDKRIAAFAFNPTHRGYCASADEDGVLCLWRPEPKS